MLRDAQKGYADMRGAFARRCLEPGARRAVERAEKAGGAAGARELGQWADDFLSVVEVRRTMHLPNDFRLTRFIAGRVQLPHYLCHPPRPTSSQRNLCPAPLSSWLFVQYDDGDHHHPT